MHFNIAGSFFDARYKIKKQRDGSSANVTFADAIKAFSGDKLTVTGPTATAGIFCTYPADYLSVWGGVVDQVRPPHCNVSIPQPVQKQF